MSSITTTKRIFAQTRKQIDRTGWLSWASILVMMLAIFISTVFILIAYVSNLFLQSIENEPQIYVFFKQGTNEQIVTDFKDELLNRTEIERIEYTNEDGAVADFLQYSSNNRESVKEGIRNNERKLPASLGVRLFSISDADGVINLVQTEAEQNENILAVRYSKEYIDTIKDLFIYLRLGGGIMMGLLLVVIFLFTLLTVEFRTFIRSEELGIMQLVGGSLWFIRSPFIFEGAFYGFIGSMISSSVIYSIGYIMFYVNKGSNAISFLYTFFGDLNWPNLTISHFIGMFAITVVLGTIIGGLNSYIAIRRYIN